MTADREEIARYLGYRGQTPDPQVAEQIEAVVAALETAAAPAHVLTPTALTFAGDGRLLLGPVSVQSAHLARHLAGCDGALLFAATLGAEVDGLLRRWGVERIAKAAVGQAAAAALLEAYCDRITDEAALALPPGRYLRPRFSPGYGDFSLEHQRPLLALMDAGRKLGLTLTAGGMLAPAKSVTAVVGVSSNPAACHVHRCGACTKTDCLFRKGM